MDTSYEQPGHRTWTDLLRLIGDIRRLAFDTTLEPIYAIGRVRDLFTDYDQAQP